MRICIEVLLPMRESLKGRVPSVLIIVDFFHKMKDGFNRPFINLTIIRTMKSLISGFVEMGEGSSFTFAWERIPRKTIMR